MSQCHDPYDTVWPASPPRAVAMVTQCHDLYRAPMPKDDDQPAPAPEPVRQLQHA
jgi:hypothetical protein